MVWIKGPKSGHGGARAAEHVKQHYLTPHMHESGGMDTENSTLPSMIFLKQGRSSRHVDQSLHRLSSSRLKQQGAPPSPTCIYGPIHEFSADAYNHTDSEFLKSENNQNRDAGSTASTAVLINLKRARDLVKSHILHSTVPGYADCNKEGNILSCERFLKPWIHFGVSLEEMIGGESSSHMVKDLLELYAKEHHILVMNKPQQLREMEIFVSFNIQSVF
ncbi:uncharacterized protein LOC131242451 [Magnolia sinica]|uniref:uncharacterized protein LOC131242451 n=1 Tax=Magnolia sinica TaxID=86752 RepID=UPI002658C2FE|nr:uncharacterized protein LOC131242451 [Magnolia sinica]